MKVQNIDSMAQGPSRAQTRGPEVILGEGNTSVKKLPCQMFDVNIKFKNSLKKYSLCNDRRCKCCPLAGKEQLDIQKDIFCKASNIVYFFHCSVCNLGYVGQCSTTLNVRINGHRSDIKNLRNKNSNDVKLDISSCIVLIKLNYISLMLFRTLNID